MSAASSIAVPAPSWVVIALIASSTMSNSAHAPTRGAGGGGVDGGSDGVADGGGGVGGGFGVGGDSGGGDGASKVEAGSTHAARTDEERSVLMPLLTTRLPVLSAAYSTLPAVSLTYAMSPLPPLTSRLIVPVLVL